MGRKDTLAAKSIRKMYEQLNLNQSDIFSKTKLLLSVYRDVVWITLSESARVNEELVYYGEELDSALVYLELFAPDTEKQEFESRISALFENKWMVDLIDTAMAKIYDYQWQAVPRDHIKKLPDSVSVYRERTARSLEYGAQYLLRPETGSDFASRRIPVGICDSELQRNF